MNGRILVTPRSLTRDGHPALARLEAAGFTVVLAPAGTQPTVEDLRRLLPGCVGYLAGVEPIPAKVLEAASPDLRVISRNGTGVDNIDLTAADRLHIQVRRADGANARGVAELTIGLLLALSRAIPRTDASLKQGGWERSKGCEVFGRTLGLVGCGLIGKQVARLALGLDLRVLATDPCPDPGFAPGSGFRYADMDTVLSQSLFISLHCPPLPEGRALVDAAWLGRIRPGTYLINTARGELLDDQAVLAALDDGRLAGLAVDAFRSEPPTGSRLPVHPRVIATAHIGAFTEESIDRAVDVAVDRLLQVLSA